MAHAAGPTRDGEGPQGVNTNETLTVLSSCRPDGDLLRPLVRLGRWPWRLPWRRLPRGPRRSRPQQQLVRLLVRLLHRWADLRVRLLRPSGLLPPVLPPGVLPALLSP